MAAQSILRYRRRWIRWMMMGIDMSPRVPQAIAPFTKKELMEKARERHIGWGPVNTAKDLLESDQLAAREYFVEVEHPELDDVLTYPGAVGKFSETPWRIQRRPPLVGEHNKDVYEKELGIPREEIILLTQAGII